MLKIQVCRHKGNYFSRNKINGKKESAVNTEKLNINSYWSLTTSKIANLFRKMILGCSLNFLEVLSFNVNIYPILERL